MEAKTIVDWEIENKSPTTESSRVDAWPNRVEVDSIKRESEPVGRFNTQQNREPIEEQGESAEQGTKFTRLKKSKNNLSYRMEPEDIP